MKDFIQSCQCFHDWLLLNFFSRELIRKLSLLDWQVSQTLYRRARVARYISVETWECTTRNITLNFHPEMHNACTAGLTEIWNSKTCLCMSLNGDITEHQGYCSQTTNMIFFSKNYILMLWVKAERGEQQQHVNYCLRGSQVTQSESQKTNDNAGLEKLYSLTEA